MTRFFALLVAMLIAVLALGCSAHVAGSDDIELSYATEGAAPTTAFGENLRALVLRRFSAAQIGAEVIEDDAQVRIIVDEALAATADELATWRGTLLLMEPDPAHTIAPTDTRGLTEATQTQPDGAVERYWEGSQEAVARAVLEAPPDRDHRVVAEAVYPTSGSRELRFRTRVVRAVAVDEIGDGVMVGWGDGGSLRLRAPLGSAAEKVLAGARARAIAIERPTRAREVLVRGRTSLGVPILQADAAVLSFGSGIEAYARAQEEKQILVSPRLPTLRRVGSVGLPTNTKLATACFVIPMLMSLAWLAFVRRFDRAHPEPIWLVVVTFALGAVATIPAGLCELALARLSPWLDPRIVTFGGQVFALPLSFLVLTFVVGTVEEGVKLGATSFAARRPEFDEPVDGIVYGIVASLGFAAAENVQYFTMTRLSAPVVIARCFMSVPAHMFFGAIWGYALGIRLVDPKRKVAGLFLASAAMHGLFDALLSTEGAGNFAVLLNVGLATVFIALVRRALRHGVVDEAMLSIRAEDRALFRVGRPKLFTLSSVALHVLAFAVFVLGAWYQLAHHRPSVPFVVGSTLALALLGVAAFGVSATMPLDVAIDAYGVTFAGAARAWKRIRGFEAHPNHVSLDCEAGPILLGPAPKETIEAISDALRTRLSSNRVDTLESLSK